MRSGRRRRLTADSRVQADAGIDTLDHGPALGPTGKERLVERAREKEAFALGDDERPNEEAGKADERDDRLREYRCERVLVDEEREEGRSERRGGRTLKWKKMASLRTGTQASGAWKSQRMRKPTIPCVVIPRPSGSVLRTLRKLGQMAPSMTTTMPPPWSARQERDRSELVLRRSQRSCAVIERLARLREGTHRSK